VLLKKEQIRHESSVFTSIGATGHSSYERVPGDFYATDPRAIVALAYANKLPASKKVWECAAGQGDLAEALIKQGHEVISTDLHDRGYCSGGTDFLQTTELLAPCILTNPPFALVTEFCTHAIELDAEEIYMFLKLQFLEGKRRYKEIYSKHPPAEILQFIERISTAPNGDRKAFDKPSAMAFCWMIWRKNHSGKPQVSWISADKDLLQAA
jgi:uncharacterized UPF0146 family protein